MEKQETTVVVQPSSEAEYKGMAHGSCELLWLKYCCRSWNSKEVDHDLHCTVLLPSYCYQSSVYEYTKHSKAVATSSAKRSQKDIQLDHTCKKDRVADFLTKAMTISNYVMFCHHSNKKKKIYVMLCPSSV